MQYINGPLIEQLMLVKNNNNNTSYGLANS